MMQDPKNFNTEDYIIEIDVLLKDLFPICRSITGKGFRDTLDIVKNNIPLDSIHVPTGTQVFDWTVPKEWNITDAYVLNSKKERVIDFQKNNLHVMNYSVPIHEVMPLNQLKEHLFSLPDYPDWIPYRTSYYKENWGFCICQRELDRLPEGDYEVCINSTLENGHLTMGEFVIPGETNQEILISCHACHPSLANDNLSGIALTTFLAKTLMTQKKLHYTYRFLFIPGTIGAITWLALHDQQTDRIKYGMVVACVGDPGNLHYKKSRQGSSEIDLAVEYILQHSGKKYEIEEFSPYGYDERQYSSPGF